MEMLLPPCRAVVHVHSGSLHRQHQSFRHLQRWRRSVDGAGADATSGVATVGCCLDSDSEGGSCGCAVDAAAAAADGDIDANSDAERVVVLVLVGVRAKRGGMDADVVPSCAISPGGS